MVLLIWAFVFMQTADTQNHGYLDFTDFRRFVRSLKTRPEVDRLYKKLCKDTNGVLNYAAFERFMRHYQKVSILSLLSVPEVQ